VGYLITAGVVKLLKVDRELMKTIQADLEIRRRNYVDSTKNNDLNAYSEATRGEVDLPVFASKEPKHE